MAMNWVKAGFSSLILPPLSCSYFFYKNIDNILTLYNALDELAVMALCKGPGRVNVPTMIIIPIIEWRAAHSTCGLNQNHQVEVPRVRFQFNLKD